jgi:hypothetical protein
MIKFFRKIRYDLMEKNNTGKYLKYAIGEIVLVVIGILIALQINSWNENKGNQKLEKKYLNGIIQDLQVDAESYQSTSKGLSLQMVAINKILSSIKDPKVEGNSELGMNMATALLLYHISLQSTTFDDLKSSGKLNLVTSDKIRQQILEYYRNFNSTIQTESVNSNFIRDISSGIYVKELDLNSIVQNYPLSTPIFEIDDLDSQFLNAKKNDPVVKEFVNVLSFRHLLSQSNIKNYEEGLEQAIQLKNDINHYLKE